MERMRPCANLIVILLTFAVLSSALTPSPLLTGEQEGEDRKLYTRDGHSVGKSKRPVALKTHRPVAVTALTTIKKPLAVKRIDRKGIAKVTKAGSKVQGINKLTAIRDVGEATKDAAEFRVRRKHRKMNRALMALLMAYKLKFATLIPTLLGGLILLISNTALAGFFFALFAAVLGLKH